MEAIEGQPEPHVRLWDSNWNLIFSGYGEPGEVLGRLGITVDFEDGTRESGKVTSMSIAQLQPWTEPFTYEAPK